MGKRGNRLRPCVNCKAMVRFVPWKEKQAAEKKNIWHWVNENGSHHTCGERKEKTPRRDWATLKLNDEANERLAFLLEGRD